MHKKGKSDVWIFYENDLFLGFAITINSEDVILIDYFAVNDKLRGSGFGTKMLNALIEHYSPKGIFLEIEIPDENEDNYNQRIRRKSFYLNIGFTPMNTRVCLFGVDMELLGYNCHLDYGEYKEFYLKNYGKYAYNHIERPKKQ